MRTVVLLFSYGKGEGLVDINWIAYLCRLIWTVKLHHFTNEEPTIRFNNSTNPNKYNPSQFVQQTFNLLDHSFTSSKAGNTEQKVDNNAVSV